MTELDPRGLEAAAKALEAHYGPAEIDGGIEMRDVEVCVRAYLAAVPIPPDAEDPPTIPEPDAPGWSWATSHTDELGIEWVTRKDAEDAIKLERSLAFAAGRAAAHDEAALVQASVKHVVERAFEEGRAAASPDPELQARCPHPDANYHAAWRAMECAVCRAPLDPETWTGMSRDAPAASPDPPEPAVCDRCGAPKGLHAVGESCNQNCGGKVVAASPDPPSPRCAACGFGPMPAASPDERLREALRDANEYLVQIADYSPSEVADAIDSVRAQIKDALAATDSRGKPDGASVPDQTRRIVVYDARCGRGGLDVPVGCTVGEAALLAAEMFGVRVGPNDRPSFGLRGTGLHASDPLPDDEDYELFVIGGTV